MKLRSRQILMFIMIFGIFVSGLTFAGNSVALGKEKVELSFLTRSGGESFGTAAQIEYWNKHFGEETGIILKQVEASRTGYYMKANQILFSGAPTPDIIYSYSVFVALYAKAHSVMDITDWFNDPKKNPYPKSDFFPIALDLVTYKGRMLAFPTDVNTYFLFYRKDLIPNPPQTYDELLEVAKKFTQKYNPDSPTKYGLAFYGRREESLPMFFYQIFKSYGGDFFDENLKPMFNSEAGIKALTWIIDCIKAEVVPPDVAIYEFMEIHGALKSGEVATGINWCFEMNMISDPKESPLVYDKMGFDFVPGVRQPDGTIKRGHSAHAIMHCVNPHSKYKEAALKFLTWAVGDPEALKIYANQGACPPHYSVTDLLIGQNIIFHVKNAMKAEAFDKYGYVEPALPDYPAVKSILMDYLLKAMGMEMTPKEALDKANQRIYELLEEKGYYR